MRIPVALLPLILASACVPVDGGAVEFSWVVRTGDGRAVSECGCAEPAIRWVELYLKGVSDTVVVDQEPCKGRADCRFSCDRQTGATRLNIPAGRYAISIVALDAAGVDLTQSGAGGASVAPPVKTPTPLLRDVVWGQPTQLGALQIVAECSARCSKNGSNICEP